MAPADDCVRIAGRVITILPFDPALIPGSCKDLIMPLLSTLDLRIVVPEKVPVILLLLLLVYWIF